MSPVIAQPPPKLDAHTQQTEQAARQWLWDSLGGKFICPVVPLCPYLEKEKRQIAADTEAAYQVDGALMVAILVLAGSFWFIDRGALDECMGALFLVALLNLFRQWEFRQRKNYAYKLDNAFFDTVCAGETDLWVWPSFRPAKIDVKHAEGIAQGAIGKQLKATTQGSKNL